MPLQYNNAYQEASQGVNRLGNTFQELMMEVAKNRYAQNIARQRQAMQERDLQQQGVLRSQQGELYKAQAGLANERVNDIRFGNQAAGVMGDAIEYMGQTDANANPDVTALLQSIAMGQAGRLAGQGRRFAPEALAQLTAMQGPQGGSMRDVIAAGGAKNLYQVTPEGAISTPIAGSGPSIRGGFSLSPGQQQFPPQLFETLQALSLSGTNQANPIASAPMRPPVGKSPVNPNLTPSDASRMMNSINFMGLDPGLRDIIQNFVSNSVPQRAMAPMTNAPAMPAQGQVPPPQARQVGSQVTTAKGTFTWTGQGWVPSN